MKKIELVDKSIYDDRILALGVSPCRVFAEAVQVSPELYVEKVIAELRSEGGLVDSEY